MKKVFSNNGIYDCYLNFKCLRKSANIFSSQYLEYDGNGITLPNGDFLFFTNASTNNGLNVMMNRVCVNGANAEFRTI